MNMCVQLYQNTATEDAVMKASILHEIIKVGNISLYSNLWITEKSKLNKTPRLLFIDTTDTFGHEIQMFICEHLETRYLQSDECFTYWTEGGKSEA